MSSINKPLDHEPHSTIDSNFILSPEPVKKSSSKVGKGSLDKELKIASKVYQNMMKVKFDESNKAIKYKNHKDMLENKFNNEY